MIFDDFCPFSTFLFSLINKNAKIGMYIKIKNNIKTSKGKVTKSTFEGTSNLVRIKFIVMDSKKIIVLAKLLIKDPLSPFSFVRKVIYIRIKP